MNGNYILEQPASSLMQEHPRWVQLVRDYGHLAITNYLAGYLHWTAKLATQVTRQWEQGLLAETMCEV